MTAHDDGDPEHMEHLRHDPRDEPPPDDRPTAAELAEDFEPRQAGEHLPGTDDCGNAGPRGCGWCLECLTWGDALAAAEGE
jgi:hypothetical protein